MKILLKIFLFTFLSISTVLLAQSYGLGDADLELFSKYRVPETIFSIPQISTSFSFNSENVDFPKSPYYHQGEENNKTLLLTLRPLYKYLNESEESIYSLNFYTNGMYQISEREEDFMDSDYKRESKQYLAFITLNSNFRKYLSAESNLSFYASPGAVVSLYEWDSKTTYTNQPTSNYYNQMKDQNYSFQFGIGWGRIRNVTPVVSALRFQERMKQLNLITNNIDENTMFRLAQKFSQYDYYSSTYERSQKYFWSSLEDVLLESVPEMRNLNEYASAYLHEVPKEIRFLRRQGLIVNLFAQVDYQNIFYKNSDRVENLFLKPGLQFELSHQLTLDSQIEFSVLAKGGPNLTGHPDIKQEYDLNALLRYSYELTDRLVCSASSNLDLSFANADEQIKNLYLSNQLNIIYFLEDHISMNASFNWDITEYKNDLITMDRTINQQTIQVGLTYHFNRGFIFP